MNSGGGDRQSPPLPGGEFLLRLLRKDPSVSNPTVNPIQSNGHDLSYINGHPQNPNPKVQSLSDSFQILGLNHGFRDDTSETREGNRQFNRFADNFYGSPNTSRNLREDIREWDGLFNGFESNYRNSSSSSSRGNNSEANNRNSPNSISGGSNRAVNGYQDSYFNYLNSNGRGSNKALNGFEANYRNSQNLSRIGEGYDRPNMALNGSGANYRNSPNSSGFGEGYDRPNRALNGFGDDNRNSPNLSRIREGYDRPNRALNGFEAQNTPNSSRTGEGYNRALNGFDSDFPKFTNYRNISRTSVARQEVKQTPPGFANKATNMNFGHNVESSSNGSRNWGIKYEDEREIGDKMIESNQGYPQLGSPVPPTGSALKSVSGFEGEESLSELHKDIAENGGKFKKNDGEGRIKGDLDDLDAQVLGSLEEDDESSDKNLKKKRDKDYRSDTRGQRVLAQWMRKSKRMIQCRRDIDIFNAPLLAIYNSLVPPEEEKMKQKQLLALLEKLVVKEWPEARLLVYGSCANSFGVKKSDIDICLAMKDADLNKCDILLKLADILKAENLENVQALTHARVPIVKLMDPVTGISCDICINNVLAVVNSKLLRDYAKIDDRLRQLAFIVKHWAKSRGVNETYHGTLSSYAYVLMCIHFLQQCRPAILPCLQGMDITYNVIVENVECAFFDRVEKLAGFGLRNRENIGQLVWGFFRYWAYCHDYTHDVVSVRMGSNISKQAKDWTRRVGNDRHLICIEDPFEITHDLGRVVDKFSIKVLREEFERAAQILQFDPNPCVTLFEPYVRSC